jgi:hypothetical protein
MALRDSMRNSAAQFTEPGETIQAVFGAQTSSPLVGMLGAFGLIGVAVSAIATRYRIVAVTDRRILILDAGKWSMRNARAVVGMLPRSTQLGPASGLWHPIDTDAGKLRVKRYFFKDIAAADAAITPVTY